MAALHTPCIVTVGLDRLVFRALAADRPHAHMERRRALPSEGHRRLGPIPDLVVLQASPQTAGARAAVWQIWGERVTVIEVDDQEPVAHVWRARELVQTVPLEPGFLTSLLPVALVA